MVTWPHQDTSTHKEKKKKIYQSIFSVSFNEVNRKKEDLRSFWNQFLFRETIVINGFSFKRKYHISPQHSRCMLQRQKYLLPQQQLRIVNQAYTVKWTKYFIANSQRFLAFLGGKPIGKPILIAIMDSNKKQRCYNFFSFKYYMMVSGPFFFLMTQKMLFQAMRIINLGFQETTWCQLDLIKKIMKNGCKRPNGMRKAKEGEDSRGLRLENWKNMLNDSQILKCII